jgi:clan AA aspartic protease
VIEGEVNADYEAVIPIKLRAADGSLHDLQAVVDTGFSGYLTLSPAEIAALQLPFRQQQMYRVGDNRQVTFDVYRGIIDWEGQERVIAVLSSDGGTLIGMRMLRGCRLFVEIVDGGPVTIEPHP